MFLANGSLRRDLLIFTVVTTLTTYSSSTLGWLDKLHYTARQPAQSCLGTLTAATTTHVFLAAAGRLRTAAGRLRPLVDTLYIWQMVRLHDGDAF